MEAEVVFEAASALLVQRGRGQPGPRLRPGLRPDSMDEGWRLQQAVSALRVERGEALAGWKCGVAREHGAWPLAALHQGAPWPALPWRMEPEFAFVMAHDLPPRPQDYAPSEIDAAVGSVHLALELIGSRYAEPDTASGPELLADGLFNAGYVLGPPVVGPLAAVPAFDLILRAGPDAPLVLPARHPDGDPRAPLHWAANALRSQGYGLRAGQVVITGSLAGVCSWPGGDSPVGHVTWTYGPYGSWTVPWPQPQVM